MIASPLVSVWSFLYDGVFVGATRAREMRDVMLLATFAVFLPAWYLLQPLGNHGLWLAFMLFMATRGLGMHWYYRRRVLTSSGT
jgi:MATE family multidrug resistance protein